MNLKKIFSITNQKSKNNKWYKVIYILGIKFSIRNKRKEKESKQKNRKKKKDYIKILNNIKTINNYLLDKEFSNISKFEQQKDNEVNFKIPVALASDNNYAKYMYVTVLSMLETKNEDTFYDFYFLVTDDFTDINRNYFYSLYEKYSNFNINFIDMGNEFKHLNSKNHITYPTYFRLAMAKILPYEKAIYLDTDVIVNSDLSDYFNTDLEDNYIAGVIAAGYLLKAEKLKQYYESFGLNDLSQYINAGVTLWNLEQIRKDNLTEYLYKLSENNFKTVDQDVVNIAFYDRIKHLPLKYNMMTKYLPFDYSNAKYNYGNLKKIYGEENIKEAIENPVIIHYADKIKPWKDLNNSLSIKWWEYASKSPFLNSFYIDLFL